MIRLRGFSVRQGRHALLHELSLEVAAGQCTALLGANGAGKSTLLRAVSGEYGHAAGWHCQGSATLDDRELSAWPLSVLACRRSLLMQLHQEPSMRVQELVRLGAYPHGGLRRVQEAVLHEVLQDWELQPLAARPYTALSGGERQRVQLARTDLQLRLHMPASERCWLLDEPQTGLDLPHQQLLRRLLRRAASQGALVLFSVHDINFALRVADRIVALKEGRLVYAGTATGFAEPGVLRQVFSTEFVSLVHPADGLPLVMPA